jgi:hypothetical protein
MADTTRRLFLSPQLDDAVFACRDWIGSPRRHGPDDLRRRRTARRTDHRVGSRMRFRRR